MPKVLLVDLSSIAHPIWHMSQAEPDPDHTSQRTAAAVRSIAAEYPHTAICCDSKSSFRKELDATLQGESTGLRGSPAPPDRPRPRGAGS